MDDLDDLRKNADFLDELVEEDKEEPNIPPVAPSKSGRSPKLTPAQRFVISFLAFMVILIFGFFFLLLTGKMVLPF